MTSCPAAEATMAKVRAELPNELLVVLLNFTPGTPNLVQENKQDTLATAATDAEATFIDVTSVSGITRK